MKKFFFLFGILLLLLITNAGAYALTTGTLVQWKIEDGGNDHWYQWQTGSHRTFNGANSDALSSTHLGQNGYLATITSAQENAFIFSYLTNEGKSNRWWIGGERTSDLIEPQVWTWLSGETWDYTNWASGYPILGNTTMGLSKYIAFNSSGGEWQNAKAYYQYSGGIVEFNAVPVPAGFWLLSTGLIWLLHLRRKG